MCLISPFLKLNSVPQPLHRTSFALSFHNAAYASELPHRAWLNDSLESPSPKVMWDDPSKESFRISLSPCLHIHTYITQRLYTIYKMKRSQSRMYSSPVKPQATPGGIFFTRYFYECTSLSPYSLVTISMTTVAFQCSSNTPAQIPRAPTTI